MTECSVYGCNNSSLSTPDSNIHYYCFPRDAMVAQLWLNSCIWKDPFDINTDGKFSARICSIHFEESNFSLEIKNIDHKKVLIKILKQTAIPTLQLHRTISIVETLPMDIEIPLETGSKIEEIPVFTLPNEIDLESKEIPRIDLEISAVEPINKLKEESDSYFDKLSLNEQEMECNALCKSLERAKNESKELEEEIKKLEIKRKEVQATLKQQYLILNQIRRRMLCPSKQKELLEKVFSKSQIAILKGKKRKHWSDDDMAVGYTVRHMSNRRSYMYITKKLKIPLPAASSVRRWACTKRGYGANKKKEDEKTENQGYVEEEGEQEQEQEEDNE